MKSYFIEGLGDLGPVRSELSKLLPGQVDPWLLLTADDDVVAYFNISTEEFNISTEEFNISAEEADGLCVVADISGRHYYQDEAVLKILRELQKRLGGVVRDDDDNEL